MSDKSLKVGFEWQIDNAQNAEHVTFFGEGKWFTGNPLDLLERTVQPSAHAGSDLT